MGKKGKKRLPKLKNIVLEKSHLSLAVKYKDRFVLNLKGAWVLIWTLHRKTLEGVTIYKLELYLSYFTTGSRDKNDIHDLMYNIQGSKTIRLTQESLGFDLEKNIIPYLNEFIQECHLSLKEKPMIK